MHSKDHADSTVGAGFLGASEQLRTHGCGTIGIGVEKNQNRTVAADAHREEFDGSFKFASADDALPLHAQRWKYIDDFQRHRHVGKHALNQYAEGLDFAVALYDRTQLHA